MRPPQKSAEVGKISAIAVKSAHEHTVVQLTVARGFFAEKRLEFGVGGDYIKLVFSAREEAFSHSAVNFVSLGGFAHALCVRRVCDYFRFAYRAAEIAYRTLFDRDEAVNARFPRIVARQFYGFSVDVVAERAETAVLFNCATRFFKSVFPDAAVGKSPFDRGECSVQPRRDICGFQRRFDKYCSAPAERVDNNIAAADPREVDQPRREGFLYRRGVRARTIAALVQPDSGSVERYRHFILHKQEVYRQDCARFGERSDVVFFLHTQHERFFHCALYRGYACQRGVERMSLYNVYLVISACVFFDRDFAQTVENVVESLSLKARENYPDALRNGTGYVCLCDNAFVAREVYAPVAGSYIFAARAANFKRKSFFKPEMAGSGQVICHVNSFRKKGRGSPALNDDIIQKAEFPFRRVRPSMFRRALNRSFRECWTGGNIRPLLRGISTLQADPFRCSSSGRALSCRE